MTLGWDLRGLRYGREKNDVGPGMSGELENWGGAALRSAGKAVFGLQYF